MSWQRKGSVSSSWASVVRAVCPVAVGLVGVVVTIGVLGLLGCLKSLSMECRSEPSRVAREIFVDSVNCGRL